MPTCGLDGLAQARPAQITALLGRNNEGDAAASAFGHCPDGNISCWRLQHTSANRVCQSSRTIDLHQIDIVTLAGEGQVSFETDPTPWVLHLFNSMASTYVSIINMGLGMGSRCITLQVTPPNAGPRGVTPPNASPGTSGPPVTVPCSGRGGRGGCKWGWGWGANRV